MRTSTKLISQSAYIGLPLIGRQSDLAYLEQVAVQQRLVTLWGAGGCGKTRLAEQVAHQVAEHFIDGVWMITFADLDDAERLPDHLVATIGIQRDDEEQPLDAVIRHLRPLRVLLVMDNCEHVLSTSAALITALIAACPHVHILATSRELINLPYEHTWQVQPFALPLPESLSSLEQLRANDAIQLFSIHAQRALPTFTLTRENAAVVAEICRLVDGIPLAIELAAARVNMFALEQIAVRLADGITILNTGNRLMPSRQQTLEATMAWSYQRLTTSEQQLFRRLAICTGSFELAVVESLCVDIEADAVTLLGHLIDKSLVTVVTREHVARYRLLETIRHYGRERLQQEGELELAWQLYSDWVVHLTEESLTKWHGDEQGYWLTHLETEIEHIRAVLNWSLLHGHRATILQIATAIVPFCEQRAHITEGRRWLEDGLALNEPIPPALMAKTILALGKLTCRQHQFAQTHVYLAQARACFEALDDQIGLADTLQETGYAYFWQEAYVKARGCLDESLLLVPSAMVELRALVLHRLALVAHVLGERTYAQQIYAEALTLWEQLGDKTGSALTLSNLGALHYDMERYTEAMEYFIASLTLFQSLGDRNRYIHALINLCDVALALKDPALIQGYTSIALASPWMDFDLYSLHQLFERIAAIALLNGQAQDDVVQLYGYIDREFSTPARQGEMTAAMSQHVLSRLGELPTSITLSRAVYDAAWQTGQAMTMEMAFRLARKLADITESEAASATHIPAKLQMLPNLPLHITAFGGGTVAHGSDSATLIEWQSGKAKELFFYLLEFPQQTKGQLCFALWPDSPPEQANAYIRVILHRLRKALSDPQWICFTNGTYRFNRSRLYWYDVEQFTNKLDQSCLPDQTPNVTIQLLEEANQLYRDTYLAGLPPQDWLAQRQKELQQQYLTILVRLGRLYQHQGDLRQALTRYQRIITIDPYYEQAHQEILRCYAHMGQRSQALRYYYDLKQYLHDELGVRPDPHITAIVKELLAQS